MYDSIYVKFHTIANIIVNPYSLQSAETRVNFSSTFSLKSNDI